MDEPLSQPSPWEPQPGEPNRWYARFESFRLAGPNRSLLATVNAERQQRGGRKSKSIPQAWAKNAQKWRWRERAEAWDDYQRQEQRASHAQEILDMNQRQLQEAKALQSTAIRCLKSMPAENLSSRDVLRYLIEAAKLERTALGELAEQCPMGTGSGTVPFSLEDAVRADQELEKWKNERLHPQ
jgi:hypothetical protein